MMKWNALCTVGLGLVLAMTGASRGQEQAAARPLMRDFMGINAHTVQFDPALYAPLCRLVRDYHPYAWDVRDKAGSKTTFPMAMSINWKDESGRFRDWSGPVDWQKLYGSWLKSGFEIDASIMLLTPDQWPNLAENAYQYGKDFAAYFGPSGEHKLVTSVEIGNEPAGNKKFDHKGYMTIFENMARGIREGDPKLKILTCAVDAGKPDGWSMPLDLFQEMPKLYDVINVHKYAMAEGWPTWERVNPEDAKLDYRSTVQKSIDWRNEHAPEKQVWITEFGFDSSTKQPAREGTFSQWKGCTDLQQAQWIVRSFLFFSEMDLDRAYLYWFNDNDTPSLHASSGVTRHMVPKPSYWAMRHLYQSLGDYRFARAIQKTAGQAYVFEYVNGKDPRQVVWVAWSPTRGGREAQAALKLPGKLVKAERMPTAEKQDATVAVKQGTDGSAAVTLSESPLYLWVQE